MIDLSAARNDPDAARAALARKGAADAFDELLRADEELARARAARRRAAGAAEARRQADARSSSSELKQVKEELRTAEEGLAAAEAARDAALGKVPNPPHESAADGDRDEDAIVVKEWGEPKTPEHAPEHLELASYDMERGAQGLGRALRVHRRRRGAALAGALPPRARPPDGERVHARAAAGARARGGDVRHRVLPVREERLLLDPRGRALPRRDVRGAADRDAHERDPRAAADPLLRVLVVLPPRVGRGRPRHARHVPRAPVPEGRDGRLHPTRRSRGTSTSGCSRSRRRSSRRSGCRTASSTARRATSRPRRRSGTTSRRGSRRRSGIARSRRARTRPTTRRAARASASARARSSSRRRTR